MANCGHNSDPNPKTDPNYNELQMAATACPRPSPPSMGALRRRAHHNVAVIFHAQYVPTLTAAAA